MYSKVNGMVVIINKNAKKEDISKALKKLQQSASKKPSLTDFFGKMKGAYGNALEYQQQIRNEWD